MIPQTATTQHTNAVWRLASLLRSLYIRIAVILLLAAPGTNAADLSEEFLTKLRERGWHDVAVEYLTHAENDPLVGDAFLARVPYELAVSRSDLARQTISETERRSLMQQAAEDFRKFLDDPEDSPYKTAARGRLGTLLADEALAQLNKAERLPIAAASEISRLQTSARALLDEATNVLSELTRVIPAELQTLPQGTAGAGNDEALARRRELDEQLAEARFLQASILFEKSRTYPAKSNEWETTLEQAAEAFGDLEKRYENKLIGFYAQLYQGRCQQALGNYKDAIKALGALTSRPVGQEVFRVLIAKALRYRAECFLAEGELAEVIEECSEWLDRSTEEERAKPEWLAVAFRLADAYAAQAEKARDDREASRLRAEARRQYREVSRHSGEFQDDARSALAISGSAEPQEEVKGFTEALEAGKVALEQVEISSTAARLAERNNPSAVEDLRRQASENRASAMNYFQSALEFASDNTPGEQLAEARYYLCWLKYQDGNTAEAAKLGLALADQYPDSVYAPTAAKISLAGYEQLYLQAEQKQSADAAELAVELESVAKLIRQRWPESDSSAEALGVLMRIALRDDRFDEAEKLFTELPEESRARMGFNLGQALWNRYLAERQKAGDTEQPKLAKLSQKAEKLFAAGYAGVKDATQLGRTEREGLLGYMQLLVTRGQSDKALELWNLPNIGLSIQAQTWRDEEGRQPLALEAFKLALQANLLADPPRSDEALALLGELEQLVGNSPEDRRTLSGIYVNLARQLQQEGQRLEARGEKKKAEQISAAFAKLLERVAEQSDQQDWTTKAWLADMSLQLADGLPPLEARKHVEQAEMAYRGILAEAKHNPSSGPSERELLAVRKKMGDCLAAQGEYSAALDEYTEILQAMPTLPELQVAAAKALQSWGISKGDSEIIDQAILGAQPGATGKNLIWGWITMSRYFDAAWTKALRSSETNPQAKQLAERYADLYYTARYNAAAARLAAAQLASGVEKEKQLQTVRQSINALSQLHPDLGGPAWKPKFEQLLLEVK